MFGRSFEAGSLRLLKDKVRLQAIFDIGNERIGFGLGAVGECLVVAQFDPPL
jgi:hypothetical protein